jgi:cyclic 2,3-diphosphoglycerate synthase
MGDIQMRPALALVDGEHYPPVVRAAIALAARSGPVVAALLLGGVEKLDGVPDYGVPLERVEGDPAAALVAAAHRHGAGRILDLSDEPVLDERARFRLAAHALAAGLEYAGADFEFRPPPREPAGIPALAVVGTAKRIGKTAVSGHAARLLSADRRVVVVAMGRGGPAAPEVVDGAAARLGVADLLARARAGEHAASDYLEDAALAGVATVGARRCGSGLAGTPFLSNVPEAVAAARALDPDLVLLEGSGAALPPVAADRTVLVTSAARPSESLVTGMGPYRILVSDMLVVTMCEPPLATPEDVDGVRAAVASVRPDLPVVTTVFRPHPAEAVEGERVALFTTAPAAVHPALRESLHSEHGADVVAVSGSLSDRAALRADLERPEVAAAGTYLTEIKAAAIDVVAEAAEARGARLVFCDNRPHSTDGSPDLDAALRRMADEAVAAHA